MPGNWIAIDFVIDSISNKRPLKNLTVIDPVSKVAPKIVLPYKPGVKIMQLHKFFQDLGNQQITALLNHSIELFEMNV